MQSNYELFNETRVQEAKERKRTMWLHTTLTTVKLFGLFVGSVGDPASTRPAVDLKGIVENAKHGRLYLGLLYNKDLLTLLKRLPNQHLLNVEAVRLDHQLLEQLMKVVTVVIFSLDYMRHCWRSDHSSFSECTRLEADYFALINRGRNYGLCPNFTVNG